MSGLKEDAVPMHKRRKRSDSSFLDTVTAIMRKPINRSIVAKRRFRGRPTAPLYGTPLPKSSIRSTLLGARGDRPDGYKSRARSRSSTIPRRQGWSLGRSAAWRTPAFDFLVPADETGH
ncbi:uncharacterized protein LOC118647854 [Monomorium pharaonis]|uniref:uncharacterized protein LOC118647854 n=1 Tax=Monomorium pharaonis TaxID=307658 RepID=UPI001746BBB9|nr:uncharacterized protein LOC118647854 [Monomorium pharaonis]